MEIMKSLFHDVYFLNKKIAKLSTDNTATQEDKNIVNTIGRLFQNKMQSRVDILFYATG